MPNGRRSRHCSRLRRCALHSRLEFTLGPAIGRTRGGVLPIGWGRAGKSSLHRGEQDQTKSGGGGGAPPSLLAAARLRPPPALRAYSPIAWGRAGNPPHIVGRGTTRSVVEGAPRSGTSAKLPDRWIRRERPTGARATYVAADVTRSPALASAAGRGRSGAPLSSPTSVRAVYSGLLLPGRTPCGRSRWLGARDGRSGTRQAKRRLAQAIRD
jgi:hypothetical protein